jgi:hypothetical protein
VAQGTRAALNRTPHISSRATVRRLIRDS